MFTIIIPFRNGHNALPALLATIPPLTPVVVVDDCSEPPLELSADNVTLVRSDERGYFTGAVNIGVAAAGDADVVILNQDALFDDFAAFVAWVEANREQYATMGERIGGEHPYWPDGYIHGTCMFIRRDAWNAVGPMDAEWFPLWGSTADWQCRAARRGYGALAVADVPGFRHLRRGGVGPSIRQALIDEPEKRGLFLHTPPLISVIIDCFNYGRYLQDAVNSLIGGPTCLGEMPGQTFQAFEIIIVDDASTDETPEIGRQLADANQAIRYIRLEPSGHADGMPNHGTPAARNAGIQEAYGRHIAILCADDMMEPWRLEEMYRASLANPHSIIYDDLIQVTDGQRQQHLVLADYDFERLLDRNHVHAGILFPVAAWREAGGYPEAMRYGREDWAFNVALGEAGWCGVKVARAGYLYRRDGQGRTARNGQGPWRERFVQQMRELFPALYAGERPMACCGGDKAQGRSNGAKAPAPPERPGLVLVGYLGRRTGDFPVTGPYTRRVYRFSVRRPRGYVDERDLRGTQQMPGLLDRFEGGRPMFARVRGGAPAGELDLTPEEAVAVNLPPGTVLPASDSADVPVPDAEGPEAVAVVVEAEGPTPKPRSRRKRAKRGGDDE